MATQLERIASLETSASIAKWVLGIFIPLVIGWGAFITINVIAMKQSLADGGNTKLVTELKAPKSPEQLQANLSTVTAQIQTARVDGKRPDSKKVAALSGALAQVVSSYPTLSEGWHTAGELISYRAVPSEPENPAECRGAGNAVSSGFWDARIHVTYLLHDCTLSLDQSANDSDRLFIPSGLYGTSRVGNALLLKNVHVVYHGGPISFPGDTLIFWNCTFEFQISSPPPAPANSLTETLLAASDINQVTFKSPS